MNPPKLIDQVLFAIRSKTPDREEQAGLFMSLDP